MGVTEEQTTTRVYVCDRCMDRVDKQAPSTAPVDPPEGWVETRVAALAGYNSPARKVLCDTCNAELSQFFLAERERF